MTALSNRDQLATLAELWGWTPEAYVVDGREPVEVDRYRRDDMLVTVSSRLPTMRCVGVGASFRSVGVTRTASARARPGCRSMSTISR
jgi:hypothetical protein